MEIYGDKKMEETKKMKCDHCGIESESNFMDICPFTEEIHPEKDNPETCWCESCFHEACMDI